MARKKRLHGLGGSPEHHAERAAKEAKDSTRYYNFAAKEASKGQCMMAFDDIRTADSFAGSARAHIKEGKTPKNWNDITGDQGEAQIAARDKFMNFCIKGGSVAGLGARRRRSRR